MKKAILATKVGMTQIFNADGVLVPVTVLQAGPCYVTQIKTVDNDGYSAVQVGFVDKKEKVVSKDANGKKEIRNRHGVNKAKLISSQKATRSMQQQFPKVKVSRAQLRDLASTEDLWLMVLNSIVIRVPTALVLLRVKYSKEKECRDTWVA